MFEGCEPCMGLGLGKLNVTEKIVIPKGVYDGVTLRIRGKGNETKAGPSGDLLVKLKVTPSPIFKREGDDLVIDKKITVCQAILGDIIKVKTIQGVKDVQLPAGTADSNRIVLKGFGAPKL